MPVEIPTKEEQEKYEREVKPKIEAAVAKLPPEEVERLAARDSEIAKAELEKRRVAPPPEPKPKPPKVAPPPIEEEPEPPEPEAVTPETIKPVYSWLGKKVGIIDPKTGKVWTRTGWETPERAAEMAKDPLKPHQVLIALKEQGATTEEQFKYADKHRLAKAGAGSKIAREARIRVIEELGRLEGQEKIDYLVKLGRVPPGAEALGKGYISQKDIEKYLADLKNEGLLEPGVDKMIMNLPLGQRYNAIQGYLKSRQKRAIIKREAEVKARGTALAALAPYTTVKGTDIPAALKAGVSESAILTVGFTRKQIKEAREYLVKKARYEEELKIVEAHNKAVARQIADFEAELKDQPIVLQMAYKKGGLDLYNEAVEVWNKQIKKQKAKFEAELKDQPKELQEAYRKGGFPAYNKAVQEYNKVAKTQNVLYRANLTAIRKLEPFTDKDDNIDIAKYLRANPDDTKTLADAGIEQTDIKIALAFNNEAFSFIARMKSDKPFTMSEADALIDAIRQAGFRKKTPIGTYRDKTWGELSNEEKITVSLHYVRPSPIRAAELVVPGVYVARNWTTLSTKDKVVNIGIDVAAVALCLGIFKVAGITARQLTGVNRVARIAKSAGRIGDDLRKATETFAQVQRIGKLKVGSPLWVKHANKVAQLQQKSLKADKIFLRELEKLDTLSRGQLLSLEKRSGLRGLTKAIIDISKTQSKLDKIWKQLGKLKFNPNATTPKQLAVNNRYLRTLVTLQRAQVELQSALSRAGSILKPRYTPSPPAAEFKGYGMEWRMGTPSPTVDASTKSTLSAIESYLARSREVTPTGKEFWRVPKVAVAIAEKPKPKPLSTLKLKAKYKEVKAKSTPKPKVPKVKPSIFPGIRAMVRTAERVAPAVIPTEAFGRMTAAQIAKVYGSEEVVDAVAKTIIENLAKLKEVGKLSPANKQSIRDMIKAATWEAIKAQVRAQAAAKAKGLTKSATAVKVQQAIRTAVREVVEARMAVKPALAPLAKLSPQVLTKLITKAIVETRILAKQPSMLIRPLKPMIAVLPRGASDKEKRKIIKDSEGAVAWRHGELHGKDVWHVFMHPYQSETDFVTVVGRKPTNATIVKGPGSAFQTIKLLYGKAPSSKVTGDIGFFDFSIEPKGGRKVGIGFTPDPKMETTGDITIGRRALPITERRPTLSGRGKSPRITPKRPRLRR